VIYVLLFVLRPSITWGWSTRSPKRLAGPALGDGMVSVERAVHDRRLYFQLRPSRLARIFGATIENIPKQTYLFADPALTAQWAETMQALPAGLNVGLVRSGNLYSNASHVALRESRRSLSFAQYAPLFEVAKMNSFRCKRATRLTNAVSGRCPCTTGPAGSMTSPILRA
jgi:hypothetical protein